MVASQRENFVLPGQKAIDGILALYRFQKRAEGCPVSMNAGGEPPLRPLLSFEYRQELEVLARERWDGET